MEALKVQDRAELERCWVIRTEVFVDEQNVPAEEEIDDLDLAPTTIHALVVDGGVDVGTGRVLFDGPGRVHIGRVAVRKPVRGTGVGRFLMAKLHELAFDEYADDGELVVALSAQESALNFYRTLGYEVKDGRRYLDAGILHQDMFLRLSRK